MLFLLFQVGNARYALDANRVVEVLPFVQIEPLPHAPRGVLGLLNYRGEPIPAVDLSELLLGLPAEPRLSTRIIVVNYTGPQGAPRRIGLVAEKATETLRTDPRCFHEPDLPLPGAPALGPVLLDPRGAIHWIQEHRLLPEPVRQLLFAQPAAP